MFARDKSQYIQKIRLEIGKLLGEKKDEDVFIELREPKTEWMLQFSKVEDSDTEAQIKAFKELLPRVITNHNLTSDGVKPLSPEEIAEVLYESIEITQEVMEQYFTAPFFTLQKRTESQSPASAQTSSMEEE